MQFSELKHDYFGGWCALERNIFFSEDINLWENFPSFLQYKALYRRENKPDFRNVPLKRYKPFSQLYFEEKWFDYSKNLGKDLSNNFWVSCSRAKECFFRDDFVQLPQFTIASIIKQIKTVKTFFLLKYLWWWKRLFKIRLWFFTTIFNSSSLVWTGY